MRRLCLPWLFSGTLLSLLAPSALAQWSGAKPVGPDLKSGFDAITIPDAKAWLGYLAGPECEGRGTGEPGFQKAADYVAAHFKALGLKPAGDNGTYFQHNVFWRYRIDIDSLLIQSPTATIRGQEVGVEVPGKAIAYDSPVYLTINQDPRTLNLGDSVKGKVVIVKTDKPYGRLSFLLSRAGAAAQISVSTEKAPSGWRGSSRDPGSLAQPPRLQLTSADLEKLLSPADLDAMKAADASGKLEPVALSTKLVLKAEPKIEKIQVPNVVAILEGTDPVLKDEYIGVGAHLDHLGRRGNVIYYGADDDGSGTTALMGLAKGLVANPVKPKRSVLFMAFYGEEMGLLGSGFLANNPPFPLTQMIAELQMDMVGRNSEGQQRPGQIDDPAKNTDTIRLVGSKKLSLELDTIIQEQNAHIGFKFLYDAEDVYTRSDHYNFASKGVPIAFFFDGFHPDYHQPTDTVDKINWEKLTNTAKINYLVIHELGRRPERPAKIKK